MTLFTLTKRASPEALPSPLKSTGGFTFLEVIFVIVILVTMYAVALPDLGVKSQVEIDSKVNRLLSDVRSAYDLAVLTGKPHRLVFSIQSADYWLEIADRARVRMFDESVGRDLTPEEEKERREFFDEEFKEYVELVGEEIEDRENERILQPTSPVIEARQDLRPPTWERVESREWGRRSLGPELIIMDLLAEHHSEPQTLDRSDSESVAMIYFFPKGYVERAVIHIGFRLGDVEADPDMTPYTIKTHPIQGTAEMISGYEEVEGINDRT